MGTTDVVDFKRNILAIDYIHRVTGRDTKVSERQLGENLMLSFSWKRLAVVQLAPHIRDDVADDNDNAASEAKELNAREPQKQVRCRLGMLKGCG